MKTSHQHTLWLVVTICLASLLAISCATTPKETREEKLPGTWANSDYRGGTSYTPWKLTYNSDGTVSRWNFDTPAGPGRVAHYIVEKTWTGEDGSTWYRLEETWSGAEFTEETLERWLTLLRIDSAGKTMERQSSMIAFPEDLTESPAGGGRGVYYRE